MEIATRSDSLQRYHWELVVAILRGNSVIYYCRKELRRVDGTESNCPYCKGPLESVNV